MRLVVSLSGTDHGRSGLGTWVRAMVPRLADVHDVHVVATRAEREAYADSLRGLPVHELPALFDRAAASVAWHLAVSTLQARRLRADAMLLPAANRRTIGFAPMPSVAVVHDLAELHAGRDYHRFRDGYVRRVVIPSLRNASRVVAVSHRTGRDLLELASVPREKLRVIENGVDVDAFGPVPDGGLRAMVRGALGFDGPFLIYPSRLEHPGKNHLRLLEGLARCERARGHHLVLTGSDWGALEAIRARASELGLSARVRWLGRVDDAWMPELLRMSDGVVMAGLHEGFGLPALEAQACGRPVAASNTGALPEVVGDLGVLFDPNDADDIARGLASLVDDELLHWRAAVEGPKRAAARSWSVAASALAETCAEVAA
jgi:glycosyltransferase involved in cell wall biosynthesis